METKQTTPASPLLVIIAFTTVYIVWGSTYFFIQKAMKGFPPMFLGAFRFIVAGIIMLAWSWYKNEKLFNAKDVLHSAVSGFLMLTVGTGAVIWVEQYLPSAMVAIMVSSAPLWFIVIDKPKWKENFKSKLTIASLVAGFIGVIVLFGEKIAALFSATGNATELGSLFIILCGSIAWSAGSLYSKYTTSGSAVTVNTAWQMLAAGVVFMIPVLWRGELNNFHWSQVPLSAWLSVGYLILFGSIAAFSAYVWLLAVRPATQVSTYAYVNPVVAVLLGVLFANETITFVQVLGLIIILGSVIFLNIIKQRKEKMAAKELLQQDTSTTFLAEGKPVSPALDLEH